MTVRECFRRPDGEGERSHCNNGACRFNFFQQQKSGEPQLPALFMADFFRRFAAPPAPP